MVNVTKIQVQYWYAKTSKPFRGIYQTCPSIHSIINSKSQWTPSTEKHNALVVVKLRQKSNKSADECLAIGSEWVTSKARQAILKRWQRRLDASRKRNRP